MAEKSELYNWEKALAVALADKRGREILGKLVKRYAIEAGENAKPMCPRKTGTLQKSLGAAEKGGQVVYNGKTYAPITGTQVEDMTYLVGSALPYCAIQEFEGSFRHPGGGSDHFIHKGIESVKKPMREMAKETMVRVLEESWKGG